ncbi:tRNA pseudouridine(55) synthase TruB [Thermodesulfovibrio sp. 3907-1M]|uniref:tRNA pseudouridine synthase B n=1 Tax=Thermodesulfovibrio autotrophicus TaxID=3118333 RepID=A0AAU8GVI9_9BACT
MNAVVVLNKSKGFTSQDAVTKVKRILKAKKAGHAGALDPMATGVLLVCLNEATKISALLMELEKEYVFKARFGISTDTYDAEGRVIREVDNFELKTTELEKILKKYTGEIIQTPPMYSAVKVEGKPLHKLARKGIEVERKPKKVFIHSFNIEEFSPPFVRFRVVCSKGTYVRALCHDVGEELGMGAHIVELERTRVGQFKIEDSIDIDGLRALCEKGLDDSVSSILNIDRALYFISSVTVDDTLVRRFINGNSVKILSGIVPAGWVKVKDKTGKIVGIGFGNGVIIKPERIIWEEVS